MNFFTRPKEERAIIGTDIGGRFTEPVGGGGDATR